MQIWRTWSWRIILTRHWYFMTWRTVPVGKQAATGVWTGHQELGTFGAGLCSQRSPTKNEVLDCFYWPFLGGILHQHEVSLSEVYVALVSVTSLWIKP
jgi:hypothetical protein